MDFDTLVDMHLVTRQSFGNRPLFGTKKDGTYRWTTYKEFGRKVDVARVALARLGIARGDVVACISSNREEWAVTAYAVYSLGAAFVPMYEDQLVKDWRYIVENSGAKALFVSTEKVYQSTYHFAEVVGQVRSVHCFDAARPDAPHAFSRLLAEAAQAPPVPAIIPNPRDLATLIYTSGTTGTPKGVRLTHANLMSNVLGLRTVLPEGVLTCHDRSLSFLPWAHSYGQTLELHALMAHGASVGIAEGIDKLLGNLAEVRPTMLFSVPALFKRVYDGVHAKVQAGPPVSQLLFKRALQAAHHARMARVSGRELGALASLEHRVLDKVVLGKIRNSFGGNLRYSFVGGAATPMEVLSFFDNAGIQICEGYGLTETSPLISINSPELKHRRLGTTGRALEGVTVKIVVDGKEVGPDEEGEICVSGPNVMEGYHLNPAATDEVMMEMDGKRFFRTGDLGRLEEGTYLRVTGRLKELFKLENGKYVVPGPIEAALTSSKYITQALLFGADKPFNVALLVPDWAMLQEWAKGKTDLTPDQLADKHALAASTAVQHLIQGEIQQALEGSKKYEIPRRWELLEEGFTQERGMLTPKMSVKRHVVVKHYHELIHHLYNDQGPALMQQEQLKVA
ncbi:long chain acyl-CoA synthetase [Tribonema minus]|uniref:Long chain acyl-CoA synthetase n=1 Tax=Tribonema minus TaxID=303371 RepID=A0A835ZGH2_9STRA|nr:long chain acyl-CoA synthetase [Tribonema minus]